MTKLQTMQTLKTLKTLIGLGLLGTLAAAPGAVAATLDEDVLALTGTWDGTDVDQSHAGSTFHLEVAAPAAGSGLLAVAKASASEASLMAPTSLAVLAVDARLFGLPSDDGTPSGYFAVEHAPFGGIHFSRLTSSNAAEQIALQTEEFVIGKIQPDGSRRLRVTRGERQCHDATSHAFLRCGAGVMRTFVMKHTP